MTLLFDQREDEMAKHVRQHRSAAQWQALVAKQAASDDSVARFCARERVSAASFYQWRSRLRSEGAGHATDTPPEPGFVDLGNMRLDAAGFSLRLDLGGGLVLQLTRS